MHPEAALATLLLSLFSADELRRFVRWLPEGDRLVLDLPSERATLSDLAHETAALLARHGFLREDEKDLWESLLAARPGRKADIDKVRAALIAGPGAAPSGPGNARPLAPAPPAQSVLRVLLVSASPDSHVRVRVDKEFSGIIRRMKATRHRDRFQFEQLQAARYSDLRAALQEHEPHILHISAHGDPDGSLLFEGDSEGARKVPKAKLIKLLTSLRDNLRLVVLNACDSGTIARDIPPTVDLAIGMSDQVADTAAIEFAVAFYESLGFGKSVETAFAVALAGLDEHDDPIPQLFPPPGNDPHDRRSSKLLAP